MIFYVYILFDWLGIPFYVGKGHGNRWVSHERHTDNKNWLKNEVIEQTWIMLGEIPKVKISDGLTEEEAFRIEAQFIALIGRRPNGPLVNMTDGGEGPSGYRHSESNKEWFSQVTRNDWANPIQRAKRIESLILAWQNCDREERSEAVSAGFAARSEEDKQAFRETMSQAAVHLRNKSFEHQQKINETNRLVCATEEFRIKRSDIQTMLWQDPEYKEHQRKAHRNPDPYIWITDGTYNHRHLISAGDIPIGWRRGKSDHRSKTPSRVWMNDRVTEKMIKYGNELPIGWQLGRLNMVCNPKDENGRFISVGCVLQSVTSVEAHAT